jgi:hypothetical protein
MDGTIPAFKTGMACWEFHRIGLGAERWTWRAIDTDGSVRLSSKGEFLSFSTAMRDASHYGFEEGRDEWYVGGTATTCKDDKARSRRRPGHSNGAGPGRVTRDH